MSELSTERLETIATWREKYGNSANVMIPAEEAELMARQILAYEQAADRPVGEIFRCSGNKTLRWWNDVPEGTVLYAAPVLPKQSELVENLKKVMNNWLAMEPKLAFQPEFTDVMMLLDAEAAPAQLVSEPYKLPSGYALVPVEPTAGMLNVGISEAMKLNANVRIVYQTMLAAAPAQEIE